MEVFRGCLSIEVNGRTVGTFRIVRYIVGVRFSGVSVKWGSTVYILTNYHNICRDVIRNVSSGFQKPSSVKV